MYTCMYVVTNCISIHTFIDDRAFCKSFTSVASASASKNKIAVAHAHMHNTKYSSAMYKVTYVH